MIKLNEIWIPENRTIIANAIKASFNETKPKEIPEITIEEAVSIETLIFNFCHTLRKCYLIYQDPNIAIEDLTETIIHKSLNLVNEYRSYKYTLDSDTKGKTHQQTTGNTFIQTNNVVGIIGDNISFNDLDNKDRALDIMLKQSKTIREIYKEIKTMVQTIY